MLSILREKKTKCEPSRVTPRAARPGQPPGLHADILMALPALDAWDAQRMPRGGRGGEEHDAMPESVQATADGDVVS